MTVVVHRLLRIRSERQRAIVATPASRVELDAEQPGSVQAEAERAVGETGLQAQDEALRPVAGLRLGRIVLAVVAQLVEVAEVEVGAAVREEFRLRGEGQEAEAKRIAAPGARAGACRDHRFFPWLLFL